MTTVEPHPRTSELAWLNLAILGACLGIVVNAVADLVPLPDPFFRVAPRWYRLVLVLLVCTVWCLALAAWTARERLPLAAWTRSRVTRVFIGPVLFTVFFLLRPRLNWGDSDWVMVMLDKNVPGIDRWLTSIHILNGMFQIWRHRLYPQQFVVLSYCILGVAAVLVTVRICRILYRLPDERIIAYAFLYSYPTFTLLSGYLEIYSVVQFGFVMFTLGAVEVMHCASAVRFASFGFVTVLAGTLYIGNIPLLGLAVVPMAVALARAAADRSRPPTALVSYVLGFLLGTIPGVLIAASILRGEPVLRLPQALTLLRTRLTPLLVSSETSWYLSIPEIVSAAHAVSVLQVWLIYGPAGLLVIVAASIVLGRDVIVSRNLSRLLPDGILLGLTAIVLPYLGFMYVKRFVMGFKDWDLFTYAVYNVNLLAGYCYVNVLRPIDTLTLGRRALLALAVVWTTFTFLIMNPIVPALNFLPPEKQAGAIKTYSLRRPIRATEAWQRLDKEIEALRPVR